MNVDFPDMGGGIIHDLPANQIPRNVWSAGENVRFIRAHVEKIAGHSEIFGTATSTASTTTESLALGQARFMVQSESSAGVVYWVYCDLDAIYQTDGTTHVDISFSSTLSSSMTGTTGFAANIDYSWNGGVLNRTVILNSHTGEPRTWVPGTSEKTIKLVNWPASTLCRVMRSYKNYLVALGISEGSGFNDNLLRWSHPADVNGLPSSWDYTDTTKDAGRVEIDDGFGKLVDCLPLRDDNIIYAEHAIYRMSPVSSGDIFVFRRIFSEVGLLTRNCIATVRNRQVFIGDGDIYVHDGHSMESIVTKRWKSWFFSQLGTNWRRSFVCPNYANNEIWFCFPTDTTTYPNKAMIWSFDDNTLTSRDIPETPFIGYGVIPTSGDDTFDGGPALTFDQETSKIFNEAGAETTLQDMVMAAFQSSTASSTISLFFEIDSGLQFDNSNFTAYVEKDALPLENGQFSQRYEYQVHAIRPRTKSTSGGNITIKVSGRDSIDDPIVWDDSATFVMGTDKKADVRVTGSVIAVRFESSAAIDWELNGFSVDYDKVGARE